MKKQIDILDEAIKLAFLEHNGLDDTNVKAIMNRGFQIKMSDSQKKRMLALLKRKHIAAPTIGEIITKIIKEKGWNLELLAQKVQMPSNVLENLASDKVFANTIPVGLLGNILSILRIPFNEGAEAIRQAFYQIKSQPAFSSLSSAKPAYRKGGKRKSYSGTSRFGGSKNRALFENEEALEKYLSQLQEVTKKDSNE